MFRRHWSGLPKDPSFPANLKDLGYTINEEDEVRLAKSPDYYFKFFLSRNPRVNDRQRFAFNHAVEQVIHSRLEALGLGRVPLPLGTPPSARHVPIYASTDASLKSRVVVIFGEPVQALGVLAGRIATGRGGIDKGSMVSVVRELGKQASLSSDAQPPAVLLANTGELYWWPEGQRCVTVAASNALPLPSAVHKGYRHTSAVNSVPHNEDPARHVEYVFDEVLQSLVRRDAVISLVAVGSSCELVTRYLDDETNWAVWRDRLSAMLLMGHVYPDDHLQNAGFKDFMAKRTRAYLTSPEPLDTPLAPPSGNIYQGVTNLGCPSYSSSEKLHTELALIRALQPALQYLETVACTPEWENPPITVTKPPAPDEAASEQEDDWDNIPQDQKPPLAMVNQEWMTSQLEELRRQKQAEETGELPADNSGDKSA